MCCFLYIQNPCPLKNIDSPGGLIHLVATTSSYRGTFDDDDGEDYTISFPQYLVHGL